MSSDAYSDLMAATDYRSYLSSIVAAERSAAKGASLKTLADRFDIGLSSLKMVLNGSRKLTMKNIHSIAHGLTLKGRDREYFESLVHRDQADDDELYEYYDQKLKQFKTERKAEKIRSSGQSMLQSWFVPALIVYLLDVEDINAKGYDPQCLDRAAKILKVNRDEIQSTFAELEQSGILQRTSDSRYHFVFQRVNGAIAKQRFLKDVFALCAQRLVSDFDHPLALFNAHTLTLPKAMVPVLFREYKELIEKYMAYAADGEELEMLQVCIQAVPLLKGKHLKK